MSVILSIGSTSKVSKKEGNVFLSRLQTLFIFKIKNAFFNVFFNFFPNVYYNYGPDGALSECCF